MPVDAPIQLEHKARRPFATSARMCLTKLMCVLYAVYDRERKFAALGVASNVVQPNCSF